MFLVTKFYIFLIVWPLLCTHCKCSGLFLHLITLNDTKSVRPLDEGPTSRRYLYLTTHNAHEKQTSMSAVGFKSETSSSEKQHSHRDRPTFNIPLQKHFLFRYCKYLWTGWHEMESYSFCRSFSCSVSCHASECLRKHFSYSCVQSATVLKSLEVISSSERVVFIISLNFVISSFIYDIIRLKSKKIFKTSKLINVKSCQLACYAVYVWCA
jgi:hypothetical protein